MDDHPEKKPRIRKTQRRFVYRLNAEPTGVAFPPSNCTPAGKNNPPPPGTTFKNNGGQALTNVHVQLIFWGGQWAGHPNPLASQVTAAVQNLLAGPYMSYLAQYGVHRGNLRGTTFQTNSEPGAFSFNSVGNFITGLIDNGTLPEPDEDWPLVHCVMMPTNSSFTGGGGIAGENGYIIWNDYDLGDVDNDPAYYLWAGNDGTLNYIMSVFSHELVEICTDPNGGNGIRQVGCTGASCQIGDVSQPWCDDVRGVRVQAYWSQLGDWDSTGFGQTGLCVLPKLYSVRRTLAGRNINGRISSLGTPIPSLNKLITSLF